MADVTDKQRNPRDPDTGNPVLDAYRLEEQIGFLLRKANQSHTQLFGQLMPGDLTPTQFAVIAKLYELEIVSQNRLGRLTSMDVATVKGVIDRLRERGIASTRKDSEDKRRLLVELTKAGRSLAEETIPYGIKITEANLNPLTSEEQSQLTELLKKIS
ncbi:MAG: MarR family winged helix-turn-helix transcriptional regulator [Methyloligellaceae bacterium]